jgi:hypothetical protein
MRCVTITPRRVSRRTSNPCQVSVVSRWRLASLRRLLSQTLCQQALLERRPKETDITGSHTLNTTFDGTAAEMLRATLPADPLSSLMISCSLDFLRISWLASDLQQTLTWSKPSPGYRNLTAVFAAPGYRYWCHGGTDTSKSMVATWSAVYRLPLVCRVYVEVRIKDSASACLSSFVMKLICTSNCLLRDWLTMCVFPSLKCFTHLVTLITSMQASLYARWSRAYQMRGFSP